MDIYQIIGIAVTGAVMCVLLKQHKPEYAVVVAIICSVLLLFKVVDMISPAITTIKELMNKASINESYVKTIIKVLGICYVTELASDSCNDVGQTAIASKVTLLGKVGIVILTLPMFKEIIEITFSLVRIK